MDMWLYLRLDQGKSLVVVAVDAGGVIFSAMVSGIAAVMLLYMR